MHSHTPDNRRLMSLLRRVARQDHAAFKQLYDLTSAHLYGVTMRFVHRRDVADQILQDAYIHVWQHADSHAATLSAPMTWLIGIARNKSQDRLSREQQRSARAA